MTLSLDVIFHIISDDEFDDYMTSLFTASTKYVIIYSSNQEPERQAFSPHFKHRKFSKWIDRNRDDFSLIERIPNEFGFDGDERNTSCSDFYIYQRRD